MYDATGPPVPGDFRLSILLYQHPQPVAQHPIIVLLLFFSINEAIQACHQESCCSGDAAPARHDVPCRDQIDHPMEYRHRYSTAALHGTAVALTGPLHQASNPPPRTPKTILKPIQTYSHNQIASSHGAATSHFVLRAGTL